MQANSRLSDDCKLTDAQMRDFIVNGYITIKTGLPRSVHETIYRKTQEYSAKEGNLGNNILPRVPELQAVFEDPVVRGAFTSILGENYVMHSHRHPHQNNPHSDGQGFHKDSYWGYQKVRHHCPRWAMAFYYPQDAPDHRRQRWRISTQRRGWHDSSHPLRPLASCHGEPDRQNTLHDEIPIHPDGRTASTRMERDGSAVEPRRHQSSNTRASGHLATYLELDSRRVQR